MTRNMILAATAAGVLALGLAGWAAAAAATQPAHVRASDGRVLQVRYEVVRAPDYTPPAPAEATRLDVLNPQSPTVVEDGVLSSQAGQAIRSLQAEDAARTAAAVAEVRAEDARIDRETAATLSANRFEAQGDADPARSAP